MMYQGGAVPQPPAGKDFEKKYENVKDVVIQVNILCQEQVEEKPDFKIWDPYANKPNCQWFHSFLK